MKVDIDINIAKKLYNSKDSELKDLALQVYNESELSGEYWKNLTTFDKCYNFLKEHSEYEYLIETYDKCIYPMPSLELNIITFALGYSDELDPEKFYHYIKLELFDSKDSDCVDCYNIGCTNRFGKDQYLFAKIRSGKLARINSIISLYSSREKIEHLITYFSNFIRMAYVWHI